MTSACAVAGIPHALALTATSRDVMGGDPDGCRCPARARSDAVQRQPSVPIGAKYPLISITRLVLLLANTSIDPFVPAGTIAALAVTAPVNAFKLAATGRDCPVGHAVRYPSELPPGTAAKFSE